MSTSNIQLQVVGLQGNTIAEAPVNLDELMAKHSMDLGQGVHVTLGHDDEYGEDDWAVMEDIKKANAMASSSLPPGTGKVNPAEWTSVASPSDATVDYSKLQPLDITPDLRKFHPIPLAFHTLCSYTDGASANRIIVYGGRTASEEQNEVYEFSLATSSWRRIEAQQPQCNGVFAHSSAIIGTSMFALGGFGVGGSPISKAALSNHAEAKRYELIVSDHHKAPTQPHTFGILPLLQQLDLRRFTWKRRPLGHQLHVAAHTTVGYNGTLYTFGGVDEKMHVSGNLTAINPKTGEVRLLRREGPAPKARCLHSAVVYHEWMIVYGGADANNDVLADVWAFNFTTEAWEELPSVGNSERMGHSCCLVGSRMLVMGGYGGWIDDEGAEPLKSFAELSLSPIKGQFLWRDLKVTKPMPFGSAFGAVAVSGSGTSFLTFGGLVLKGSKQGHYHDDDEDNHSLHSSVNSSVNNTPRGKKHSAAIAGKKARQQSGLFPTGAVTLIRFPDKVRPKRSLSTRKETLSGDPHELSAEAKAFLRRQDDFIVKRDFSIAKIEGDRSVKLMEATDANLYLRPEEVQEILEAVTNTIDKLSFEGLGGLLPEITPDRAARITHITDSKALLVQAKTILASMMPKDVSGHVKSHAHRKMEGAPEEHGGAKPFRRVLVMSLVDQVHEHLTTLNKLTFGTFNWDHKEDYIAYAKGCERSLKIFMNTMAKIRNQYIQQRIKSMEDDSKRHGNVMERLKAKIDASRTNKKPVQSTFKGTMKRDFEVLLEKESVKKWKATLDKAVEALNATHARCDKEAIPPATEDGQPSYLYKHVVDSAKIMMLNLATLSSTLKDYRQSKLPTEENTSATAHFKPFSELEVRINENLSKIEVQSKILTSLVLRTTPGEPTKAEKAAGEYRDAFVKVCAKTVQSCRQVTQVLSASFLSYVPPKKKFEDPHTHAPVTNKRAPSARPVTAEVDNTQRQVVELSKDTQYRPAPAPIVAPPPPAPALIVRGLAEPLQTSFDANSSQLLMPTWTNPFPNSEANNSKAVPLIPSDGLVGSHFDFFRPLRSSAVQSTNTSLLPQLDTIRPLEVKYEATVHQILTSTPPPLAEGLPVISSLSFTAEQGPSPLSAPPPPMVESTPAPAAIAPATSAIGNSADLFNPYNATPAISAPTYTPQTYSHLYAADQPYHTTNTSLTRPHTPAECPCTPFNPEYSKDRSMFKGRLTPGERSILTSRQQNTMW